MKHDLWRPIHLLALSAALAGCAIGPNYHRPEVPVPAKYAELRGWTQAAPADAAPRGAWWSAFDDPLMDRLEPLVETSNPNVAVSYANYRQALAAFRVARSEIVPTIGVTATASRAHSNAAASTGAPSVLSSGDLEGTASWTLDLWGAVRRRIQENAANAEQSEALLANALLAEQTLLATTVVELRVTDAQIALHEATVKAYRESLRITEQQAAVGLSSAPPSAVLAARVALETEQATLTSLGIARAQYVHALAVLVGQNPEELSLPRDARLPKLPEVPAGLPSTLLQRRPDIAAAERAMAAANAGIGVAEAAYFPTISLSAADGVSQSPLRGLLHSANNVWSLGASGAVALIDLGARRAGVVSARAAYDAALANYRATVLGAFEHVENDLASLRILAEQAAQLDVAVRDAKQGTQVALAEFEAGTVDYTAVSQAQIAQLLDQESALQVAQSRLVTAVALIGDVGGGWSTERLHDPLRPLHWLPTPLGADTPTP
ncbi:MAG: efflux transporter outer membrane subunit [Gammaproteobacteria bacterium]|nr:efflux transporter outer membrane subunit [Gammaproteobacteria bacterium]